MSIGNGISVLVHVDGEDAPRPCWMNKGHALLDTQVRSGDRTGVVKEYVNSGEKGRTMMAAAFNITFNDGTAEVMDQAAVEAAKKQQGMWASAQRLEKRQKTG